MAKDLIFKPSDPGAPTTLNPADGRSGYITYGYLLRIVNGDKKAKGSKTDIATRSTWRFVGTSEPFNRHSGNLLNSETNLNVSSRGSQLKPKIFIQTPTLPPSGILPY